MPVLLVILFLVNFSPLLQAETGPTQIRGPKSADSVMLQKQFGPLSASDTLWRIAEQVKPSNSVSTYQVMYAIFVKNPQAFNDANFNHLQPGAVLLLPDLREIRSVDPEVAKRKAEMDDDLWAQKVAREAAARARSREQTTRPNPVQQQTAAELNVLKDQYQDSMQLIEGIARENENLRGTLSRVEQELQGLKAQLAEDSVLQQQLNQLLQQQQQILAEQQAAKEAEDAAKLAEEQQNILSKLLNNPLSWVIAASAPAILLLLGGVFLLKRRGRKTEEAVAAAVKEPTTTSGYQSPLPPLDTSQDFDDSLFDIDDSLLNDSFSSDDKPKAADAGDSFLDDELPDFSDDIVLDDLDDEDPLQTDILDSDSVSELDKMLGEEFGKEQQDTEDFSIDAASDTSFDANNILSDMDLSALLMAEDEAAEVIELADPEETETENLLDKDKSEQQLATSFTEQDDIDSLLEEIELDLPQDEPETEQSIEDLLAEHTTVQSGIEPANSADAAEDEDSNTLEQSAELSDAVSHDFDEIDAMLLEQEQVSLADNEFDNSDLDEFAEQLAAEVENVDENALLTEDELLLNAEMDDILEQAAAQQILPAEQIVSSDNTDGSNEDALPLADDSSSDVELISTSQSEDGSLSVEALDDVLSDDSSDSVLQDETELDLDLATAEDSSVSRPTEAALAVENPSQVLESYPELNLQEFEPENESESEFNLSAEQISQLTQEPELQTELASTGGSEFASDFIADPAPDTDIDEAVLPIDFDEDELTAITDMPENLDDEDEFAGSQFDELLNELEAINVDEDADFTLVDDKDILADAEQIDEPAMSDADFVEIDNLLQAMDQSEVDSDRFNHLNVDVGLDEFADIIGEHNKMDVDQEDAGFAGKLDLIRAYIEMDEPESATLLIDELLTSAAPEHVKDEAKALRPD